MVRKNGGEKKELLVSKARLADREVRGRGEKRVAGGNLGQKNDQVKWLGREVRRGAADITRQGKENKTVYKGCTGRGGGFHQIDCGGSLLVNRRGKPKERVEPSARGGERKLDTDASRKAHHEKGRVPEKKNERARR